MQLSPQFDPYPIKKINGKSGSSITLTAADVGAASAPSGAVARAVATAGQTDFTMAEAVPTGKDWTVLVTVDGVMQDPGVDFTTDGSTNLHFTFAMIAGQKVVMRHVYGY